MTIHVVVMGVAGCGKSAVGRRVAAALALPMVEGDDFHPPANVERMRQGVALTDADRAGWLAQLGDVLQQHPAGVVLSCSALKRAYRQVIVGDRPDVRLVYLKGSRELIGRRMAARQYHFMPPALLDSQFAALEEPG